MKFVTCLTLSFALSSLVACASDDVSTEDASSNATYTDVSVSRDIDEGLSQDADEEREESVETDAVAEGELIIEVDSSAEPEPELPADIQMSVRLINAGTGGAYSGVSVSMGEEQATSDPSGVASVMVAPGPYHVVLEAADARAHHLYGIAGDVDFEQISYMSPESITMGVFGSLAIQDDPARGTLVVGLDRPNLAPAVGASASIDVASDPAFIFAGFFAEAGATIVAGGQSFVTFPNVEAGPVEVSTSFPEGECLPFPALSGELEVEIHPGEVSVVAFICESIK